MMLQMQRPVHAVQVTPPSSTPNLSVCCSCLHSHQKPVLTPASSPLRQVKTVLQQAAVGAMIFASTVSVAPATAFNVRLKDVENPAMQAGVRAATEERLGDAERLFQVPPILHSPAHERVQHLPEAVVGTYLLLHYC